MALIKMPTYVGGGGGGSIVILKLTHILNSTTITRKVNVDGTDISGVSDITGTTSSGNVFDSTASFTVNGKSVSWRVYHSGQNPILNNVITIDGVEYIYNITANSSLSPTNNLSNAYDWASIPLGI